MNASLNMLRSLCSFLLLSLLSGLSPATAQESECISGIKLGQAFSSGAAWSLCAAVDDIHGLEVADVFYRAPGNFERKILHRAHLGQLLLHYHDQAAPEAQINATKAGHNIASESLALTMNPQTCDGELLSTNPELPATQLCARVRNNHILAKYAQRPSLQSERWELLSSFERNSMTWTVKLGFTEDGQIIPGVSLSGRATRSSAEERYAAAIAERSERITRATILSTWKLVFDLDTDADDVVEQFEFPLMTEHGNRRPLQVTSIETEALRKVHREYFRGWRVLDQSGSGYYLDPANSGFSYRNNSMNWAQFDIAVTRYRECEEHALFNTVKGNSNEAGGDADGALNGVTDSKASILECGANLDNFVDGEELLGAMPVIWYSQTRSFRPSLEDWPVISNIQLSFNLMPFDWTQTSPFETLDR